MENNFDWRIDNYRRSTVVLEKQPKVLQQVFELPTFDFSKQLFKRDFKKLISCHDHEIIYRKARIHQLRWLDSFCLIGNRAS